MNKNSILAVTLIALTSALLFAQGGKISEVVTQNDLDQFLNDKKNTLAVIEFYDPTCPVCNAFKKTGTYPAMAQALPHIKFAMISVKESPALHEKYTIKGFPTFVYFKNGKEIARSDGYTETRPFINKVSTIFANANLEKTKTELDDGSIESPTKP